MKQNTNENAANRTSYVGHVYTVGERAFKREILNSLPAEWKDLHDKGYIHIHDLDAYGLTYNCLTFNLVPNFPYERFNGFSEQRKIVRKNLLEYCKLDTFAMVKIWQKLNEICGKDINISI